MTVELRKASDTSDATEDESSVELIGVSLKDQVEREVIARRDETGNFTAEERLFELETKPVRAEGEITDSLFLAADRAGVPANTIVELIRIFSFDVDFQREIQPGDSFSVMYERKFDESDRPVKEGNILFASMTLSGKEIALYRYTPKDDGIPEYFTADGKSIKKTLMRTPVDGARLSSGFGKRKHPILGYTRMHRGVDFAAPRGTPIMAAGSGVVEMAARHGGYGNYVRIRHNGTYKTAYAHMKGFAKGIRKGARVRQGQIIGYIGTTGRSTGPHLHYEVLVDNAQVDPRSIKLPTGRVLKGKELKRFAAMVNDMDRQFAALPSEKEYAKLAD